MARSMMEGVGMGSSSLFIEGMSSEQRCQSTDSLAEWRSCEQVENGIPSTSPPYWDTNDDDDCGARPSDLFGKFIWNIENFSQVNKREMKSNAFEAGGYKWYILMYPQGCDVSNHLSLFLCVANHDKLLPGWSHFAQFTIAVENTDPKKSKFSDTLHRFSKKEHDWGWKRFMELSKVSDGFIVADTLVIKAQVQVIRVKAHRPFHCLDRQYRRELLQIYLSNVEQICRRFVEERRGKLSELIEDKMRWLSFRAFWLGIDQNARRHMSRDKADAILKVVVKHFFIEKEVTSTLVMDSLCSGLKALECQSKNKKGRAKLADMEELPASMVHVEKDMFVLADDVLLLLERVALEPLPHHPSPPKNDKGSQRCSKDGSSGEELNKDSILRDERRLTELGRRTVEFFVFAHIFSRIEVAYQEAVALKRQEELIREEEAAGQIENELKAKRGAVKGKRSKKKQGKHKRNTRKSTERGKAKSDVVIQDKHQTETPSDRRLLDFCSTRTKSVIEKIDTLEEASDVSDTGDDVSEAIQPELDDRDASSVNWDTDASEIHPAMEAGGSERQNGQMDKRSSSIIDDSCSTCSTDSVLSVVMNGSFKGSSLPCSENQTSPVRVKSQRSRDTHDRTGSAHCGINSPSDSTADAAHLCGDTDNCRDLLAEPETVLSLKDQIHILEQHLVEKEGEVVSLQKKLSVKDQIEVERPYKSRTAESSSLSFSPGKKPPFALQQPKQQLENTTVTTVKSVYSKELSSISPIQTEKSVTLAPKSQVFPAKSEAQKLTTSSKSTAHQVSAMSSPSAPLIVSPRPTVPIVSTVQTTPFLSRSISAAGRLATDPSLLAPSYIPQSYRNAIVGKTTVGTSSPGSPPVINSTSSTQAVTYSQSSSAFVSSISMLPPQTSARNSQTSPRPGFTFGSVKPETLHSQHQWIDECSHQEATSISGQYGASIASETKRLDIYGRSSIQAQGTMSDEFPHLAIINDLLDEDQSIGKVVNCHHHSFNRQYTFPRDVSTTGISSFSGPCRFDRAEQYYNEGFQRVNGSPHELRDAYFSQMDRSVYANGQSDEAIQKQWPYRRTDLSMLNLGCVDANGHSYRLQDYLNSSCGENGYNLYRSASWL